MNGCQESPMSGDAPIVNPIILIVKEKRCYACGEIKPIEQFHRNKSKKDGHSEECKPCKVRRTVAWGRRNKGKKAIQAKRWSCSHRAEIAAKSKKWREANPEIRRERLARWRKANPEKDKAARIRHMKKKLSTVEGKLNHSMSRSIWQALKRNKNGSWRALVDFNLEDLKRHLEKQFKDGMTWENYGEWEIDHKIPISVFNYKKATDEDFKRCWCLKNFQPLWKTENIRKSNKLTKQFQPRLVFE